MLFTETELDAAAALVHQHVPPTPALDWPLLAEALGAGQVIVKHENHAPTGAFKVRGGVTFMDWLTRTHPGMKGVITATRGNHGQSQARAASALGLRAKIVVPHGNSVEKNAAMRAYGAELIEHGADFDEAKDEAMRLSEIEPLFPVPPFHRELVRGVATYGLELFRAHPDLDRVYVPIGCGSGICGVIAARDALGLQPRSWAWYRRAPTGRCARSRRVVPCPRRRHAPSPTAWRCGCRWTRRWRSMVPERTIWAPSATTRSPRRSGFTTARRITSLKGPAPRRWRLPCRSAMTLPGARSG